MKNLSKVWSHSVKAVRGCQCKNVFSPIECAWWDVAARLRTHPLPRGGTDPIQLRPVTSPNFIVLNVGRYEAGTFSAECRGVLRHRDGRANDGNHELELIFLDAH